MRRCRPPGPMTNGRSSDFNLFVAQPPARYRIQEFLMSLFNFKRQAVSVVPAAPVFATEDHFPELKEVVTRVTPFDSAAAKAVCFAQYSATGTFTEANDNYLAAIGYTLDELRGVAHANLVESTSAAGPEYPALWSRLRQGETVTLRYGVVVKADAAVTRGTNDMADEVWFQSTFIPMLTATGTLASVTEVATDITAYHEQYVDMQQELEARTAIQNVTSIVSWADKKGDITDINQMYIDVSKFPREELLGAPHSITRHADMPKSAFKDLWNTIGHGKIWRGQIKNLAKDGSVYFVDTVVAPILGKNGKPQRYLGVRYELTKAELARQHMQGIVDALDKSLASIEFELNGTVITANGKFCEALGYTKEELAGKHHSMLVEPSYRDSAEYREFWQKLGRGEYQAGQFKRIGKGGREVWIQASYNPINDEMGRPVRVIKYATNVTDQVRAQQALEAAVTQTQGVVKAAQDGDLTQRIELDGKAGSIRDLCAGVNDLVENMAGVV
ncbi:MAG: PAS domain S-box protein, partial [Nevskiaceae bacterium]